MNKLGRKISISYRSKLVISYLILISIPFTIGGIYLYNNVVDSVSQNSTQIIEQDLRQEVAGINAKIDDIEKTGYLLSTNSSITKFLTVNYYRDIELVEAMNNEVMPMISWIASTNKEFKDFRFLTDNKYIPENEFFCQIETYKDQGWFSDVGKQLSLQRNYWEFIHKPRPYLYSKAGQDDVYSLFYPTLVNPSDRKAYLEINVDVRNLFGDTAAHSQFKNGFYIVVDGNGNAIYGKDKSLNGFLPQNGAFVSSLKKDAASYPLTINKSDFFINTLKIDRLNSFVVSIVPMSAITGPLSHAKYLFITILLTAMAVIFILSSAIANILLVRVKRMLDAVRKIQTGNFDINIPVRGEDEIDELARDINIMSNQINDLINKVYKSEIAQKKTVIYALQAQINPHFLFNTLETFRMMAEMGGQEDLSEGIASLGNLMRYNISIGKKSVEIQKELEIIQDYIQIQNLLLNNRIEISCIVPPELMKCRMPVLIVQPLVENSILHGFKDKPGALFIEIRIARSGGDILITVRDNGVGITPGKLAETEKMLRDMNDESSFADREKSIGLVNVNNRLALNFGEKYGLTVGNSEEGGFTATIRIPYSFDI